MKRTGPDGDAAARLAANAVGRRAEWAAALLLRAKGYRVLARNVTVRGGEIDLVVRRGATVAFVEVKARPNLEEALGALTATKRRRISVAARVWLTRNPWAAGLTFRGDGVFLAPRRWPRHVADAFALDLGG